ncbi:MAG: DUF3098 domain-containing protein [Calditrichaeota bacterium]|nr:DUF3098 domain-containing protein [Calditrichota bacterium]
MAKKLKHTKKKKPFRYELPFGRENYIIFLIGVFVTILGYIFMAQGPAESFWSLTLAPILLVVSYCVLFPLAIIYHRKTAAVSEPKEGIAENQQ